MVLVDTSVWVDFFKSQSDFPHVTALKNLISSNVELAICGVIYTEVLQGIKSDKEYRLVKELFDELTCLPMPQSVYLKSAEIYRDLRKKGITIRKPIDCMIGSVALVNNIPLLHNDKDFKPLEEHFNLQCI